MNWKWIVAILFVVLIAVEFISRMNDIRADGPSITLHPTEEPIPWLPDGAGVMNAQGDTIACSFNHGDTVVVMSFQWLSAIHNPAIALMAEPFERYLYRTYLEGYAPRGWPRDGVSFDSLASKAVIGVALARSGAIDGPGVHLFASHLAGRTGNDRLTFEFSGSVLEFAGADDRLQCQLDFGGIRTGLVSFIVEDGLTRVRVSY